MKGEIQFKMIAPESADYKKAIILREKLLLKPLSLSLTLEELETDKACIHVAGFLGNTLCATAVLVPEEGELKLQRVAIKSSLQNRGIGSALLLFCEEHARKLGYKSLYCYARKTAVQFYLKNKYELEGISIDKEGIPHHKMRKELQMQVLLFR